jgi:glutathione peroxidase
MRTMRVYRTGCLPSHPGVGVSDLRGIIGYVSLHDIPVRTLAGAAATLPTGTTLLIVNVASRCGFTPQYAALERLHERFAADGFSVVGFPSNQFGEQEPGTAEEIQQFCSTTYGVTFPLYEKTDVNGADRHPIYAHLVETPDADGRAGDVQWNFEKFLVDPAGSVVARFRTLTDPEAPEVVEAIRASLPDRVT